MAISALTCVHAFITKTTTNPANPSCPVLFLQLAWLQRQQELLVARHVQLSRQAEGAAEELEVLRSRRAAAIFDVELQLRLKQGQVGWLQQ